MSWSPARTKHRSNVAPGTCGRSWHRRGEVALLDVANGMVSDALVVALTPSFGVDVDVLNHGAVPLSTSRRRSLRSARQVAFGEASRDPIVSWSVLIAPSARSISRRR